MWQSLPQRDRENTRCAGDTSRCAQVPARCAPSKTQGWCVPPDPPRCGRAPSRCAQGSPDVAEIHPYELDTPRCFKALPDVNENTQMCWRRLQLVLGAPRCAGALLKTREGATRCAWDPPSCARPFPDVPEIPSGCVRAPTVVSGTPPRCAWDPSQIFLDPQMCLGTPQILGRGWDLGYPHHDPVPPRAGPGPVTPRTCPQVGTSLPQADGGELPPPFPSRNHPAAIPCRMRTPGGMKGWQGGGRGQCPRSQLATAATSKASGAATAAGVPRGGFEGPFMGAIRIYSPSRALGGGQRPP